MSDILDAVHETAQDLYDNGVIDTLTMRHFDAMCLTPIPNLASQHVKQLRERFGLSQAVLAQYLNVSTKLVQKWEQGVTKPKGAAAKLLALASKKGLDGIT